MAGLTRNTRATEREPASRRGASKRAVPRYRAIAEQLLADIARGRYPVGSALPTEIELCRRFDASRHTVREA
ncbi:MAG: GntR family transcriptional regulator, partial [Bradyrhizobium sp.]|uniref:GntR family transcriptional regulator n=1 Tax=Bradyrhizobium sp. TaxID=376 RepID=UPI001E095565